MKSLRKPLFWLLIFFLLCLVCCAVVLGGYVIWGPALINRNAIAKEPTPMDSLSKQATLSAYGYEMDQYFNQNDMNHWMDTADKAVALDPNNYNIHLYRANIFLVNAEAEKSLLAHMMILSRALDDADKAVSLDSSDGDGYIIRAMILLDTADGYPYRADREYFYKLALENMKVASNFDTSLKVHPERLLVNYETNLHNCEAALTETINWLIKFHRMMFPPRPLNPYMSPCMPAREITRKLMTITRRI